MHWLQQSLVNNVWEMEGMPTLCSVVNLALQLFVRRAVNVHGNEVGTHSPMKKRKVIVDSVERDVFLKCRDRRELTLLAQPNDLSAAFADVVDVFLSATQKLGDDAVDRLGTASDRQWMRDCMWNIIAVSCTWLSDDSPTGIGERYLLIARLCDQFEAVSVLADGGKDYSSRCTMALHRAAMFLEVAQGAVDAPFQDDGLQESLSLFRSLMEHLDKDSPLHKQSLIIEFAAECAHRPAELCDFIVQREGQFLASDVTTVMETVQLSQQYKSVGIDIPRQLLVYALDIAKRMKPVDFARLGDIYRRQLMMCSSRQQCLEIIANFEDCLQKAKERGVRLVTEDINAVVSTAYNNGVTLMELGQHRVAERFVESAARLLPHAGESMSMWKTVIEVVILICMIPLTICIDVHMI